MCDICNSFAVFSCFYYTKNPLGIQADLVAPFERLLNYYLFSTIVEIWL